MIGQQFPAVSDTIAQLLANPLPAGAAPSNSAAPPASPPTAPFLWGAGGRAVSADQLAADRAHAAGLMKSDYSPVGHWLQGVGRAADNVIGGFEMRDVQREEKARAEANQAILAALMPDKGAPSTPPLSSDGNAAIAALLSGDPQLAKVGELAWERDNRKPAAPHYWETNNGSLGMVGPDGKPQILYQDPDAKLTWIQAENGNGTKTLIPVGPNGPITGTSSSPAPSPAPSPGEAPPADAFVDFGGASRMLQSMPLPKFLDWQKQYGTPIEVVSEQQFRTLPAGVQYIGPDGVKRIK